MRSDWITPGWQAAILPDLWDVAGFILPPLSVWHVYALRSIGNGYVCGAPGCDRDDAASLLVIAGRDYRDGKSLWTHQGTRERATLAIRRKISGMDWVALDRACYDYAQTCTRTADRWKRQGSKPGAVPEAWHLVSLLSGGDITKSDAAWNTPYAVASALYDAWAERSGDDTIMTAKSQELADNWNPEDNT